MSNKETEAKIDYIEFPSIDLIKTKTFFTEVFHWQFKDYGPEYTSFNDGRLRGGFYQGDVNSKGPLVVIYASELEATQTKIENAGGKIVKQIFSFPGGRRFHFHDPSGNELGVWSDS